MKLFNLDTHYFGKSFGKITEVHLKVEIFFKEGDYPYQNVLQPQHTST